MKIINLKAENIKRLIAVDITPTGALVEIKGKNGAGKSSVLDAIWYALGGEANIPGEPVRKGQAKGSITLDLGEIVVERKLTQNASSLMVRNREGVRQSSPQSILDALCGKLTFDPLGFARLPAKQQARVLSDLAGLDLAGIEAERKAAYEQRTIIGRDLKRIQSEVASFPVIPDPESVPEAPDIAGMEKAVEAARAEERHAAQLRNAEAVAVNTLSAKREKVKSIEEQIAALRSQLTDAEAETKQAQETVRNAEAAASGLTLVDASGAISALTNARAMAAERKVIIERNQRIESDRTTLAAKRKEYADTKALHDALEAKIAECDKRTTDAVATAKFPLEGLAVDAEVVRYNSMPFDQCSSAEQLRISTIIAMRLNPKLRVLRISDGSLLDADNLAALQQIAEAEDYQIWIERVGTTDPLGILIEDGMVRND